MPEAGNRCKERFYSLYMGYTLEVGRRLLGGGHQPARIYGSPIPRMLWLGCEPHFIEVTYREHVVRDVNDRYLGGTKSGPNSLCAF